jgi:SPP1 family predicted phage head-tail adaptor
MLQAKIRRGELDREITFIKAIITRGTSNQDKVTGWEEVAEDPEVFARRKELPGNEMVIGNQLHFIQRTEFIVAYRTDLTTKNRIVFDDKVYEIISIVETPQRKMYLQIMANYLDNVANPLIEMGAFTSGFSIGFNV